MDFRRQANLRFQRFANYRVFSVLPNLERGSLRFNPPPVAASREVQPVRQDLPQKKILRNLRFVSSPMSSFALRDVKNARSA
jgi:hypothetical protein